MKTDTKQLAAELRRYNAWRRGNETLDQPSAAWVSTMLDEAADRLEELERELAAERALADRLTALLKRDRDGYGGQVVDPECDCCDCEYLGPIDEALAAWKEARGDS